MKVSDFMVHYYTKGNGTKIKRLEVLGTDAAESTHPMPRAERRNIARDVYKELKKKGMF